MSTLSFRRLKRLVSIETVLADQGRLGGLCRRAGQLVGPCPIHHGDNPRAFVISRSNQLWHCFTRCGGGDVIELVRRLTARDYPWIAAYLADLAERPPPPRPPRAAPAPVRPFRPFTTALALDPHALQHKGITAATATAFDAGRYHGPGFLAGCLGVRLHDPHGHPLGYAGRRLDPEAITRDGKWKLPPRLPKTTLLYNLHRLRWPWQHALVVVECPWGVMRLAQLHIPAVALLGTQLSGAQQHLLQRAPRVILMLDGDRAGRAATARLAARLASTTAVSPIALPDGLDPDDLSDRALNQLVRPFLF